MNNYDQNKTKDILRKIEAEEWYAEGVKQNRHELSAWGYEQDYK